ncbi:MAG TPA: HAMP domain-containing sensor histidine kinase [Candidatus Limnocylindrales bacterium]|nr:HAMP domain-containing sensor histidine kinase [Candidatus Limnocylindrales bacterium]
MRLQTRLALLFGAVVTAAAALMGVLAYAAIAGRLASEVDASLLEVSAPLAEDLADGRVSRDLADDGDGPRDRSDRGLLLPTQALLTDGAVVRSPTSTVLLPVDDTDLALARSAEPDERFRNVTVSGVPLRMLTQTEGASNGAIQVGRDISENVAVLRSLAWLLTLIGVVVAALAALAGWLLARRSAARLVELTEAAEAVTATGRLDVPVATGGTDEIGRLGSAFDAMLLRLGQAREDQQRLVQDAGHELRTPLTSLRTNVHLLGQYDALPPQTRARVIADLQGETSELTHLVNEIVHLAESGPADAPPEPVQLSGLARSVVARAERRTGRRITLTADGSTVLGNPTALERAIWNLVENAAKFSPPDTPIELVVDQGSVVVRDVGPGIDPADLPHVFDRFYRSTAARALPGSGLGLAIVRDVALGHGGRVFAANQPGGGAELGFTIPLANPGT